MDDAAGREPADVPAAQVAPRENEPEDVRPRAGQIPIHEERRAETCTMRTRGPPRLRPETLRFRDRLRPGVEPVCREDTVDMAHLVAGADLQPQVVIHRVPVALVHAADGVE